MRHVAVIKGGLSSERNISLVSGSEVAKGLREAGYKVTEIDMQRDIVNQINSVKPDVIFNALHGTYGEDGCLPGLLNILGIPYTHSGVAASAIAMDKILTQSVCQPLGIPFPSYEIKTRQQILDNNFMPCPCVIKPISEGSSFGVFILTAENQRQEISAKDLEIADKYIVQPYVPGRELTCAILGNKALGVMEIVPKDPFYNFDSKYIPGGSVHVYPPQIPKDDQEKIMEMTLEIYNALGCRGTSRADLRYDEKETLGKGKIYFLEINTHPGMTPTSLVPDLAKHNGISFSQLVDRLVQEARCD